MTPPHATIICPSAKADEVRQQVNTATGRDTLGQGVPLTDQQSADVSAPAVAWDLLLEEPWREELESAIEATPATIHRRDRTAGSLYTEVRKHGYKRKEVQS